MKVADLTGQEDVDTCDQLITVLGRRWAKEVNAFILSFQDREFPQLWLLVRGDLAYSCYLPGGHPGFISRGSTIASEREEEVSFPISVHGDQIADQIEVMKTSIIPVSAIVAAGKEFFASDGELPRCIEWHEL
jgi:hypothetical protein